MISELLVADTYIHNAASSWPRPFFTPKVFLFSIQQYKDVISDKLGHCKKAKAKLYVKEDAIPKLHRPRPLPLALKAKVEKELDRQVKLVIIQKVDVSEWGTPIVPVVKPSEALRLCGDYKVTVNLQLQVNQYPLPCPEELFAALNGGQKFTTLDLSEAEGAKDLYHNKHS